MNRRISWMEVTSDAQIAHSISRRTCRRSLVADSMPTQFVQVQDNTFPITMISTIYTGTLKRSPLTSKHKITWLHITIRPDKFQFLKVRFVLSRPISDHLSFRDLRLRALVHTVPTGVVITERV